MGKGKSWLSGEGILLSSTYSILVFNDHFDDCVSPPRESIGDPPLRYSQFLALHQQLTVTHHGSQLQGFVFPKKQLTNNFHPDVLETRQSGFKDLLNRIAGSKQLRSSPPVLTFLTKFELEEGKRKFLKGEWQVAAQMLAKVREIQALLGVETSLPLTLVLLAALVEGSSYEMALPYLEETLADPNLAPHYHLPLLRTGHHLAQSLGMDTRQWVKRLAQAGYVKNRWLTLSS